MSLTVWAGIALLILANALYVAAEFGAVGVRRSRVRRLSEDGNRRAERLLPFVESPAQLDRYVAASQVGITLSSLVLGAFAQATVAVALGPRLAELAGVDAATAASTAALTVLAALTAVQVVLSELVPKSLALQFPTEVALATVTPMRWSLAVFRPLIAVLNGSANRLLRLMGVRATTHRHIHSPAEIDLLIAESRDGGLLEPDEQDRLRRALHLRLRTARDLMVPRDRLTTLAIDTPWEEIVRTVSATPFSRVPVYRDSPDNIAGTLRVKDLVHRYVSGGGELQLDRLIRPVVHIRQDLPADQVIATLRDRRVHQAMVTDEADRVVGLITFQDVLGAFLDEPRSDQAAADRRAAGGRP